MARQPGFRGNVVGAASIENSARAVGVGASVRAASVGPTSVGDASNGPTSFGDASNCVARRGAWVACAASVGVCVVCAEGVSACVACAAGIGACVACAAIVGACVACDTSVGAANVGTASVDAASVFVAWRGVRLECGKCVDDITCAHAAAAPRGCCCSHSGVGHCVAAAFVACALPRSQCRIAGGEPRARLAAAAAAA